MFAKKTLFASVLLSLSSSIFAQGLVLNDANLRTDLNWLVQQGVIQLSTSTWPLSGDEINRALRNAKVSNNAQQKVIDSIKNALQAESESVKVGLFAKTDTKNIPQNFGDKEKAKYTGSIELNAGGENWDTKIRVNGESKQVIEDRHKVNLDGSYVAGKLWNQWIAFGQMPTWWGPGHESSLIRGDASRSVVGFTAQRAEQKAFDTPWLSWVGSWQYQLFGGQLQDYTAAPGAKIIGMRLTAQPLSYLELGASRVLQWGGGDRSESWRSFWNAFKGNDNFYVAEKDNSNQLGGFDARLNLQPLINAPISLYGQMIGEDEAGYLPSKWLYLAGADYSSNFKNMPYQLYAEWSDTRTNGEVRAISYTHWIYKDGFYQQGYPLADSMGGDGQRYSIGGDIRIDTMNRLGGRLLYAHVNQSNVVVNKAFPEEDKIKAIDLTWTHYIKPTLPIKINGWISDSDQRGNDSGVSVGVEVPLDLKSLRF